jgi:hypothetical protein
MPLLPNPDLGAKTAAGTPNFRELAGARASFEPRHGEAPARWHVVKKPGPTKGPAGGYRASPPGPLNATTPSSLPSRPGPAAPATIRRRCARSHPAPLVTLCSDSRLHGPTLRESFPDGRDGRRPAGQASAGSSRPLCRRHVRAFPGHDGLHKYAGHAGYRAVGAHDGRNADDVISRPNKRAPNRLMGGDRRDSVTARRPSYLVDLRGRCTGFMYVLPGHPGCVRPQAPRAPSIAVPGARGRAPPAATGPPALRPPPPHAGCGPRTGPAGVSPGTRPSASRGARRVGLSVFARAGS